MLAFVATTIVCFITYLYLTTGSGDVAGLWSIEELFFGLILSLIAGFISHSTFFKNDMRMLNPIRWILFLQIVVSDKLEYPNSFLLQIYIRSGY